MVRLKVNNIEQCFNSTMVRLKETSAMLAMDLMPCFNSTMVRLKVATLVTAITPDSLFQFHNGSIKSREPVSDVEQRGNVSIPQWFD